MTPQSGYQQHLGPSPHIGYKMGAHPGLVSGTGQQMGLYNTSNQQYPLPGSGGYTGGARPQGAIQYSGPNQNYSAPPVSSAQQLPVTNNMAAVGASGGQYPGRPLLNHVPHSQFAYQQNWSGSPATCSNASGKGTVGLSSIVQSPVGMGTQSTNSVSTGPKPPHYLKQHLQHKIGFGNSGSGPSNIPPSPGAIQGYNTTGAPPGMGPPIHQHSGLSMGPPIGTSGTHHHQGKVH